MQDIILDESLETDKDDFEELFGFFGQRIIIDNNEKLIIIKGINLNKFYIRLKEMFKYKGIENLFEKKYSAWSEFLWKKEIIRKRDMKIVDIKIPLFFAIEVYKIFEELAHFYGIKYYDKIATKIYKKTWVSNHIKNNCSPTPIYNLKNIKYTLKDYQIEFIEQYNILKAKYDLVGHILTFEQGLGKTLTAIALAECLNKNQIIIVCPNSLRDNWALEIKSYFEIYSDENILKRDVYVKGNYKLSKAENPKYIIVNQESIDSIFNIVRRNNNTMIIVDECHNFRNNSSDRTKQLLKLKELVNASDTLMMSGTPIKAIPNEIIPSLRMIDPYFTEELANIYRKSFNEYSEEISRIVKERFDRIIYRKTKAQVLKLPNKTISNKYYTISNPEKYYIENLKKKIAIEFAIEYNIKLEELEKLRDEYNYLVRKYSIADYKFTEDYLSYIFKKVDPKTYTPQIHEHRLNEYNNFLELYVYPNMINNINDKKRLEELYSKYLFMNRSAMGIAIGRILPAARTNCYIELFDQNIKTFVSSINNNPKKTVIFTQFLQVANHISEMLTKNNIKNVLITGAAKDRMKLIEQFKYDDNTDVLVATSQTLSTGVTLTEADQMFFFGTPYRSADFEQACDRIHRIGQTNDVFIYVTLLKSDKKNVTDRIQEIIEWSGQASSSVLESIYYSE